MNNNLKNITITFSFILIILVFMVTNILLPDKEISYEERRKLTQAPSFTIEKFMNGDYFENLEKYLLDQFPLRQSFRKIKSFIATKVFNQKDNNDMYTIGDSIFKMEYKLNEESIINSANLYNKISDKYFKNSNIYYSIVPDKNYFVSKDKNHLSLDYEKLTDIMKNNIKNMKYIDIMGNLQIGDYYNTDLHWRQENLIPVANKLLLSMGNKIFNNQYEKRIFEPFYGAYYGQAATNIKPDKLTYLTNQMIENCKVYDFEKQEYIKVYNDENFNNVDAYDIYLSGAKPLLSIENSINKNGKELYIFRDSFGSSLSPLLISEYSKIILIDLRYINSKVFEEYIKPKKNSDVLFMYNTSILNNSKTISTFFIE